MLRVLEAIQPPPVQPTTTEMHERFGSSETWTDGSSFLSVSHFRLVGQFVGATVSAPASEKVTATLVDQAGSNLWASEVTLGGTVDTRATSDIWVPGNATSVAVVLAVPRRPSALCRVDIPRRWWLA